MKRIIILILIGFETVIAKPQTDTISIDKNSDVSIDVQIEDEEVDIMFESEPDITIETITDEDSTAVVEETDPVILEDEPDEVTVLTDEIIKSEKSGDTTNVKIGDIDIDIYEDGTKFSFKDEDDTLEFDEDFNFDWKKSNKKFKGHWSGLELGLNNFVDNSFSIVRETGEEYMEINTGKSWNFNLNFAQYSLPIFKDRFGLVSGMGLEWSNYQFDNNLTIAKDNGVIAPENIDYPVLKNKLVTTYLTAPLLVELQMFNKKRSKRLHISGGVIGGLKISSHTKIKYNDDGDKKKEKNRNDFYISPFRYALTGRIGYRALNLYFNYYMTDFFQKDKGPELNPIAMGFVMSF